MGVTIGKGTKKKFVKVWSLTIPHWPHPLCLSMVFLLHQNGFEVRKKLHFLLQLSFYCSPVFSTVCLYCHSLRSVWWVQTTKCHCQSAKIIKVFIWPIVNPLPNQMDGKTVKAFWVSPYPVLCQPLAEVRSYPSIAKTAWSISDRSQIVLDLTRVCSSLTTRSTIRVLFGFHSQFWRLYKLTFFQHNMSINMFQKWYQA